METNVDSLRNYKQDKDYELIEYLYGVQWEGCQEDLRWEEGDWYRFVGQQEHLRLVEAQSDEDICNTPSLGATQTKATAAHNQG